MNRHKLFAFLLLAFPALTLAVDAARLTRGQELYARNCFACHQLDGAGVPGVFPPLAKSDYLNADVERAIRAVVEGLTGKLVVNGQSYAGAMPPIVLDDADVADVFTYMLNHWGNAGGEVTAEVVARVRSRSRIPTFARLRDDSVYAPLPKAPAGYTLREVARLPQKAARMASDGTGRQLFLLSENGDVMLLDVASGNVRPHLAADSYLERRPGDVGAPLFVIAMTLDREGRLYLGSNQQNDATLPVQNIVTIYRTTKFVDGLPTEPKVWFQTSYPGNSGYVHGLEHIAFGPDGMLYANSGARTDAAQAGPGGPRWYTGGETPITSCMWQIDPKTTPPTMTVYARGLRNAAGFCWNDRGEMFATENGPTLHAPEELNQIEQGRHYGFPFIMGDVIGKTLYDHLPEPPKDVVFTAPIANLGPDGGFDGTPHYTFDYHSSPAGMVCLGDDFPAVDRGSLVLARFGNMEKLPRDVGYDVVQARLTRDASGKYQASVRTLLAPLGRPFDVHLGRGGKIFILEYSRGTTNAMSYVLPGRVLELAVKAK
ncbi:MAG TPA: c-type cytochrome [Opitutaceae bacterium]|nr:c-type cytochrome [Opitutaceae bacterium]